MNPFKHKQLEEFTIADCELYISKYPYGEHVIDVKRHLRNLRNPMNNKNDKKSENIKTAEKKKTSKPKSENNISSEQIVSPTNQTNRSEDVTKTVFAWIGIIVVVLVVGTIIITILNEILPYDWWNKYRYIIYPALLALGREVQKNFNW